MSKNSLIIAALLFFAQGFCFAAEDGNVKDLINNADAVKKQGIEKDAADKNGMAVTISTCDTEINKFLRENNRKLDAFIVNKYEKNVIVVVDAATNTPIFPEGKKTISEFDNIVLLVCANKLEVDEYSALIVNCGPKSVENQHIGNSPIIKQSTGKEVKFIDVFSCANPKDSSQLKIHLTKSGKDIEGFKDAEIQQYKRYHSSFQVAAVWTDMQNPIFSKVDLGGGDIIKSDVDNKKGPEYMASVVYYGIFHHLAAFTDRTNYYGRDIINEKEFLDKVGLAFSIGIDKPKDTFGIGLSYELSNHINLTVTRLYKRLDILDGVKLGDNFAGTTIPTKKSWESATVFGISLDSSFFGDLFTKK